MHLKTLEAFIVKAPIDPDASPSLANTRYLQESIKTLTK